MITILTILTITNTYSACFTSTPHHGCHYHFFCFHHPCYSPIHSHLHFFTIIFTIPSFIDHYFHLLLPQISLSLIPPSPPLSLFSLLFHYPSSPKLQFHIITHHPILTVTLLQHLHLSKIIQTLLKSLLVDATSVSSPLSPEHQAPFPRSFITERTHRQHHSYQRQI